MGPETRARKSVKSRGKAREGAKQREKARVPLRGREKVRTGASKGEEARMPLGVGGCQIDAPSRLRGVRDREWRLCRVQCSCTSLAPAPPFGGSPAAEVRVGYCHIGQGSYQSGRHGWSSLGHRPDPRTACLVGSSSCIGGALLATPVAFTGSACHAGHPRATFNHCVLSDRG